MSCVSKRSSPRVPSAGGEQEARAEPESEGRELKEAAGPKSEHAEFRSSVGAKGTDLNDVPSGEAWEGGATATWVAWVCRAVTESCPKQANPNRICTNPVRRENNIENRAQVEC